jgi:hypothetical protein
MSLIKRSGDGRVKVDWGAALMMIISAILGGVISAPGVYYGIKYDLRQQDYRTTNVEKKVDYLDNTVNNLRLKDAADSANFANACLTLNEIKKAVDDIRKEQIRRERKER